MKDISKTFLSAVAGRRRCFRVEKPLRLLAKTRPVGAAEVDEGAGETRRRSRFEKSDQNRQVVGIQLDGTGPGNGRSKMS